MNRTVKIFAFTAILGAALAVAQNKTTPQAHKGSAETTLIGVSLFDTGQQLIAKYGSPNEIQGLSLGAATGGSGATSSGAGRSGPAAGAGKSGGAGGGITPNVNDVFGDPFDTGNTAWQELTGASVPGAANPPSQGGGGGGGAATAGAPKGGGASAGTTQGSGAIVMYTRWVYNRGSSRYAFVLDKFSRVVQIEAFGLWDSRVKTRRGAMFGSSFGSLVKKYNAPDGYEINGDTIVMRYLNRDHVAFRLQRTDPKKGHVVTGIVVAAGK